MVWRHSFNPDCRRCSRLANFLDQVKTSHPDYYCRPVAPFGETNARLLIVGLAPGKHGANATGRPFTGDFAGILLYQTLHKFGFSSASESLHAGDGLELINCRITNAVKCLPPDNKPLNEEIHTCNDYLQQEIESLPENSVIVTLGLIAHKAVLRALGMTLSHFPFAHSAVHDMPHGLQIIDSYHCSRYNTQTRRLTADQFEAVFQLARETLNGL